MLTTASRKLAAFWLAFMACCVMTTFANYAPNEFVIQASNYDKLADHAFNCTFRVDRQFAVTYCADGFFALDDTGDLVNPGTAFKINANLTFALSKVPKDLRLDTYLSIVDDVGEKLTVIKRSTMEALHIQLNKKDAPTGSVLGGFFSPDFVVFQILNGDESFLQVHTSKHALDVEAVIDNDIINYEVLDLAQEKDLFYVYATQQVSSNERQLAMIQIAYSSKAQKWLTPAHRNYALDPLQCSDKMKVTESLIVMTCFVTQTITILRRSNMETLYQKAFNERVRYFEQLFLISKNGGRQTYIFYSMSSNLAHRVGMFEVLLDEQKETDEQLILDWGELNVPSNADAPITNEGPINLGGGSDYLLTTFETFSYIKGYTMCAYDQVISGVGSTMCKSLKQGDNKERYTLNPFDLTVTECGAQVLSLNDQNKLAFLCDKEEEAPLDLFMMIVLGTLAFGGIFCCTSFCIFCNYRKKTQNAIDDANLLVDRVHDPLAAQRMIEQQNKMKLTLIAKLLPKKKFANAKSKENQESCAICVEDFAPSTMIRETPCKHIFHDACVMKWIETKVQAPDCPFCRAEIKLGAAS